MNTRKLILMFAAKVLHEAGYPEFAETVRKIRPPVLDGGPALHVGKRKHDSIAVETYARQTAPAVEVGDYLFLNVTSVAREDEVNAPPSRHGAS